MWKKISSKTVFTHPRITLLEDMVELPDGNQVPYLVFQAKNDSVTIICTKNDKVLLQKEYSYPPNELLYQFPGGKVEKQETIKEAALRELAEESALEPAHIHKIGWFYTDNRRSSSKMHVFVATNCKDTAAETGDIEEDITSQWISIKEIDQFIKDGKIVNYSLLAAWSLYKATTLS